MQRVAPSTIRSFKTSTPAHGLVSTVGTLGMVGMMAAPAIPGGTDFIEKYLAKDEHKVLAWLGGMLTFGLMASSGGGPKKAASATGGGDADMAKFFAELENPTAEEESKLITRIVLTGGPCGGKSSAYSKMQEALTADGYSVYFAPEVPTILINGGCLPQLISSFGASEKGDHAPLVEFETQLLSLQLQQEKSFNGIAASSGKKSVVFYDRGTMDIPAYLPGGRKGKQWQSILEANGWTEEEFLSRYDMVLHLVTAANGAEKFYTTENNAARTETAEQARALDAKMAGCWEGSNMKYIDNSTGFPEKMQRCVDEVRKVVQ